VGRESFVDFPMLLRVLTLVREVDVPVLWLCIEERSEADAVPGPELSDPREDGGLVRLRFDTCEGGGGGGGRRVVIVGTLVEVDEADPERDTDLGGDRTGELGGRGDLGDPDTGDFGGPGRCGSLGGTGLGSAGRTVALPQSKCLDAAPGLTADEAETFSKDSSRLTESASVLAFASRLRELAEGIESIVPPSESDTEWNEDIEEVGA